MAGCILYLELKFILGRGEKGESVHATLKMLKKSKIKDLSTCFCYEMNLGFIFTKEGILG